MKKFILSLRYITVVLCFLLFACSRGYAQYIMHTVAGTGPGGGTGGFAGDGGPATAALMTSTASPSFDAARNLYFADVANNRIRKIDTFGIISTVAGSAISVFSGDGGPATAAGLSMAFGVAAGPAGNLYLSDGNRMRRVNTTGIINTIGGTGIAGCTGDGGPATDAAMKPAYAVAADAAGNVYMGELGTGRLRKISASGIISTVAGTGTMGFSGDGGPATNAMLNDVRSIAVDAAGNLFFADLFNHRVRKIDVAGIITTVAGSGPVGVGYGSYSGDGGPATNATINAVSAVATDAMGNIYIGDYGTNVIRKVNSWGIITTIAGNGTFGLTEDACAATNAAMKYSQGIAIDVNNNIYVADADNNRIRKISLNYAPSFMAGRDHAIPLCMSTALPLNTLLAVIDSDRLQPESWSAALAPAHGSLSAAYTATSGGVPIVPSGLVYTPVTGYTGPDSFRVVVADCAGSTDSAFFHITIGNCTLGTPAMPEQSGVLQVLPNPCAGHCTVMLAGSIQQRVCIVVYDMTGHKVQETDTMTNALTDVRMAVPPGTYFITATAGGAAYRTTVVVE